MSDAIKLSSVALDCPDAGKLAAFYAHITGGTVTFLDEAWLAAGATKYVFQPNADHCYVFADPAGHPFCLSTWDDVPS